ncbi:amidase [Dactylosporangium sp. NPDC048998]|uniref:amidase n=1 Tax=Dactylosporangium sp. NPDC048998 TaxID=3363976 RepID=UPI0037154339
MRRHVAALLALVCAAAVGSTSAATPALANSGSVTSPSLNGIDLEHATIPDLQHAMNQGRLSAVQLTAYYLHRIQVLNPTLHAVIATNPDALRLAAASDARRRHHALRGPMDGITVLLKDNIDTNDKEGTTAGSFALAGSPVARDAGLVSRLRDSGAVILGKANLSEWSSFRSTSSSNGWSAVAGQTANPYVLDRNPCGSSSGPAVAVAANLATVAVGTETDGSIVCPAGTNGIVGVKPSLGLVSRSGIVPISHEQDQPGPIARHVVDAAILLAAMNGADARDPQSVTAGRHALDDYTRFLRPQSLKGKRIGVWRGLAGVSPETDTAFDQALAQVRRLGASTVDVTLPYQDVLDNTEFKAIRNEFKHDLNAYLAARPGNHPQDLAGLIQYNLAHPDTEMPFWTQNLWDSAQLQSGDLTDPAYVQLRTDATSAAQRSIDETMATYHLDAIVAPTNNAAWKTVLGQGDGALLLTSSGSPAVAGYPNLTVPMGFAGPLPLGMSIMGGRYSEPTLLAFAYAFEQRTQVRRAPTFRDSIG